MIVEAIKYPNIKEAIQKIIDEQDEYGDYFLDWLLENDENLKKAYVYYTGNEIIDFITAYKVKDQLIICPHFMDYSKEEQEMKEIDEYFGINIILSAEYFEYDKYGYTPCNDRSSFSKDHTYSIRGFFTKNQELVNFFRDEFERNCFPEYNEEKIEYVVIDNYKDLYKLVIENNEPVDDICSPHWKNSSNVSSVAGFHYFHVEEVCYPVKYLIATIDNKPIGLIKLATESEKNTRQYLCYIDVNEKYQRKGVAKKLINELKNVLREDRPLVLSRESEQGKEAQMAKHFKNANYPVVVYTEQEYEELIYKKYYS